MSIKLFFFLATMLSIVVNLNTQPIENEAAAESVTWTNLQDPNEKVNGEKSRQKRFLLNFFGGFNGFNAFPNRVNVGCTQANLEQFRIYYEGRSEGIHQGYKRCRTEPCNNSASSIGLQGYTPFRQKCQGEYVDYQREYNEGKSDGFRVGYNDCRAVPCEDWNRPSYHVVSYQ